MHSSRVQHRMRPKASKYFKIDFISIYKLLIRG